jgi:hypothetical protein
LDITATSPSTYVSGYNQIVWPIHPNDSYSSRSGLLEHTNISQNQPHVLGESLVKSLGEACRQLADATQGSGITARVGLSHNDAAVTSYSPSLIAVVESSCMEARKVKSRLSAHHFLRRRLADNV